jgi:hypothetical protein
MPPPIPHPKVTSPDGGRSLLEFSHPMLAITGIACWMLFTFVHYRPLAWIAFVILVVTMLIGLGWLTYNRRSARRQPSTAWSFPPAADLAARPGRGLLHHAHGPGGRDSQPRLTLWGASNLHDLSDAAMTSVSPRL